MKARLLNSQGTVFSVNRDSGSHYPSVLFIAYLTVILYCVHAPQSRESCNGVGITTSLFSSLDMRQRRCSRPSITS